MSAKKPQPKPLATPLKLKEWVLATRGPGCRVCRHQVAADWFDLLCGVMAETGIRVGDMKIAERMTADTGVKLSKHSIRTHRTHSDAWAALGETCQ